ncbi:hypothetical protein CGI99_24630 [Vibrio parahaemolyticus]|uniref:Uncharacterized protein n=2 Tax=Vibrio TaxID=662 RepID=A0A125P4M9_9VIBR|nr:MULTISPECIES: hypothetical protein [Vibrio]EII7298933.1 hypothetical protein [Vibrio cholerae]ANB96718.1 hypothetical protein FORC14_1923 [Vibrio parahaemolyticus]EGR0148811.1 hypothetical protein [Vibrio alginolyticus]EJL6953720.1 hypothetical protein [Vibrio cholerae]KWT98638.1 hypothetical protein APQ14_19760 [Vibrio toranzoniae]
MEHQLETVEVTINSDGRPVPLNQFSEYFSLLRACYVLALDEVQFQFDGDDGDVMVAEMTATEVSELIASRASTLTPREVERLASTELAPHEELYLQNIMRRNPFEVVFLGIGIALTAALIVSGGKFEFGLTKLKIEIPPLGEGIEKLRKAFRRK